MLKHELVEAQQMREKDAEKHRREEARLQERHEALVRFTKVKLSCPFDPFFSCRLSLEALLYAGPSVLFLELLQVLRVVSVWGLLSCRTLAVTGSCSLGFRNLAPLITSNASSLSQERANGGGLKQACLKNERPSLHRKCSSLQLGASSSGLLSELAEEGIGAKIDGGALSWDSGPSGETLAM